MFLVCPCIWQQDRLPSPGVRVADLYWFGVVVWAGVDDDRPDVEPRWNSVRLVRANFKVHVDQAVLVNKELAQLVTELKMRKNETRSSNSKHCAIYLRIL
jgi:hypothetical protein